MHGKHNNKRGHTHRGVAQNAYLLLVYLSNKYISKNNYVLSFHITFARKNVNILKQSCLIYGISFYQKLLDTMGFYPSSWGSTAHNNFHFTAEDLQRERKKKFPQIMQTDMMQILQQLTLFFFFLKKTSPWAWITTSSEDGKCSREILHIKTATEVR